MRKASVIVSPIKVAVALLISATAPAQAEKRVALLIGNNAYHKVLPLKTAINDARPLAGVLRKLNLSVFIAQN
jgi:Caspase domain